jgi:predicted secreted protein
LTAIKAKPAREGFHLSAPVLPHIGSEAMLAKAFAIVAGFVALFLLHAAAAQERSETHRRAVVGAPFEIALVANPSTGYQWHVQKSSSADLQRIEIEDLGTSSPPSRGGRPLLGAPVIHTWLVTPRRQGSVRLVLVYSRAGEDEPPPKTHTYVINIVDE